MTIGQDRLTRRMARGCEFLGCEIAILGGAMSWVSERHLVSAVSNAGGFGLIACGAMTPELLDAEIAGTKAMTGRPFGVNLITMHPQLMELIAVCAKHRVGHVVLAGGLPPKGSIEAIKESGAKVICFAPALAQRTVDVIRTARPDCRRQKDAARACALLARQRSHRLGERDLAARLPRLLHG